MNARKLLTSLAVSIMLTDMLLVLLAFAPATITNGFSSPAAQPAMVRQTATPHVLAAGNGPTERSTEVSPAWLRNFRNWLRNCWDGIVVGDKQAREKCYKLQSRR